jgi:hypothetical protein
MEREIKELIISNEDEAWDTLKKALAEEIPDTTQIVFKGWPVFKLSIEGKDFKGTIPTRIMPPILDLQREIHRIYCRACYNTEDTRKLTIEEREILELVVAVKSGSSKYSAKLFKALNEIIKNSNMNGNQVVIVLVSISVLITTSIGWTDWLNLKETQHGKEISIQMSAQETARLQLVVNAMSKEPTIQKSKESISNFKSDLSKKLKEDDQISINGTPIITGAIAAEIVPKPRVVAQEKRLDGEFIINEVKFPKEFGGKYRFAVTRLSDRKSIIVDATPETLSMEQITLLKESSFKVKKVLMKINAKELRGHISNANLVSITLPEEIKN